MGTSKPMDQFGEPDFGFPSDTLILLQDANTKSYGSRKAIKTGKASISQTHSIIAAAEKANAAARAAGVSQPNNVAALKQIQNPPMKHVKRIRKPSMKSVLQQPAMKSVKPIKLSPVKKVKHVKKVAPKPKKPRKLKKPHKLAGSAIAWHAMMHQRADAIEKGIKKMKEANAKSEKK